MMLRHPLRTVAVVALVLACAGCGIKGPLYLPPRETPATDAAPPAAPPAATPPVSPGPSSPPLPPTATPPVERKP